MQAVESESNMVCTLCKKFGLRYSKASIGEAVWVDIPSKTLIKQSLVKLSKGEPHISAMKMKIDLALSRRDGGII